MAIDEIVTIGVEEVEEIAGLLIVRLTRGDHHQSRYHLQQIDVITLLIRVLEGFKPGGKRRRRRRRRRSKAEASTTTR